MLTASKRPWPLSVQIFWLRVPFALWYVASSVPSLVTYLQPQPAPEDVPKRMPSPFAAIPHSLARRAAQMVARDLLSEPPPFPHDFDKIGEGKMLGVLVVIDPKMRVGFLRAASGMLGGLWMVPGFAPPVFDLADRETFWPRGQAELAAIEQALHKLFCGPDAAKRSAAGEALAADHAARQNALALRHSTERQRRAEMRKQLDERTDALSRASKLTALAEQSRADRREGKLLRKTLKLELAPLAAEQQRVEEERLALKRRRTQVSNELLARIQDGYTLSNAKGESTSLRSIFAPNTPPGGSGDCAAPKLLAYAHRHNLRPVALAEFWWGASPLGGGRHAEHFYPPCKSKCGPLLPFLLQGVVHEDAPVYATESVSAEAPICLFEDAAIAVLNKPSGMLSVPGAQARLQDSALSRLRARYPDAEGPLLVHRLDLDTSGLLVMAKTLDAYRSLQARFARREIEKRYVAWLDGTVTTDHGEIRLPLRVDLEDRPRQIYDPVHGKEAVTQFLVMERRKTAQGEFTKVEFRPQTGRTHQLRVHAAHALGLGAPILGDRLYGKGQGRLLLHAEHLRFPHPTSGALVEFRCQLPAVLADPDFDSIHLKL